MVEKGIKILVVIGIVLRRIGFGKGKTGHNIGGQRSVSH